MLKISYDDFSEYSDEDIVEFSGMFLKSSQDMSSIFPYDDLRNLEYEDLLNFAYNNSRVG